MSIKLTSGNWNNIEANRQCQAESQFGSIHSKFYKSICWAYWVAEWYKYLFETTRHSLLKIPPTIDPPLKSFLNSPEQMVTRAGPLLERAATSATSSRLWGGTLYQRFDTCTKYVKQAYKIKYNITRYFFFFFTSYHLWTSCVEIIIPQGRVAAAATRRRMMERRRLSNVCKRRFPRPVAIALPDLRPLAGTCLASSGGL